MEKLVLVTHNKYQRLLGALSTKHSTPNSTAFKRKDMPQPHPRNLICHDEKGGVFIATSYGQGLDLI